MHECHTAGHTWRKGLDLSGHCFLLISCNLAIIEEAKAYIGWERIKDMIRNEEHRRTEQAGAASGDSSEPAPTPLSKLKNEEFLQLRSSFTAYTPFVR